MAERARVLGSLRLARLVACAAALAVALAVVPLATGATAGAAPPPDAAGVQARVDAARRETDALSQRYFAQLDRFEVVGSEIAATESRMTDIRAQSDGLRAVVARRALRAYKSGGSVDFVLEGTDISDVARGTKFLSVANARDDDVVSQLGRLTDDLRARRAELEASRQEQVAALDELKAAQRKVDGNLRAALADQQVVSARLAAQAAAAKQSADATRPSASSGSTRATTPSAAAPVAILVAPPVDYAPTGGSHPHHDDPFLSCTRERESHGDYSVVNPSGPYLGAYQFLQSTWNVTAQHAGRSDLVGIPPNAASAYDQDDMAWTLYQWQGTGPWGGAC